MYKFYYDNYFNTAMTSFYFRNNHNIIMESGSRVNPTRAGSSEEENWETQGSQG